MRFEEPPEQETFGTKHFPCAFVALDDTLEPKLLEYPPPTIELYPQYPGAPSATAASYAWLTSPISFRPSRWA